METIRLRPNPDSDAEIAVDVLAGRAPAWVFLHGMTSHRVGQKSDTLLARAERRGQGFARPDFRGHGESDGDLSSLVFTHLVEDVHAVVEKVGRCVLIGSSMGGLAAAWAVARDATDVAALVLLSPALGFLPEMAKHQGSFALRRSDEAVVELQDATLRDAAQFDETQLADGLHLPVLVIHGSDDRTVPVAASRELCAAIPHNDKELWIIEGGSHSLTEVHEALFDRMEAFLGRYGCLG